MDMAGFPVGSAAELTDPSASESAVPAEPCLARPLVIVGPTAAGKSQLALGVARLIRRAGHGAVIVSLDSMQVYAGMDAGTAKATPDERDEIPHHLIDLVAPSEEFTVAQLQRRAVAALEDIRGRNAAALLVGGTGLYVRAVIDDLRIPGRYPEARAELEAEPDDASLYRRLCELDPVAAERIEPTNRRRILRALEVTVGSGRKFSSHGPGLSHYPPASFVQVGLKCDRRWLDERIERRFEQQLAGGLLEEAKVLAAGQISRSASQALGYKELFGHLNGETTLDEAVASALSRIRRFARRQQRWFLRDPRIHWVEAPGCARTVHSLWQSAAESPVPDRRPRERDRGAQQRAGASLGL